MKRRTVPVYDTAIWLTNDREDCRAFILAKSQEKPKGDPTEGVVGMVYTVDGKRQDYRVMAVFDGKLTTAIHEAVHLGWAILDHCEVEIDADNTEPLAYLVEWVMREWLKAYPITQSVKQVTPEKPQVEG